MKRKEAIKRGGRKTCKRYIAVWLLVFAFVSVLIAYLFTLAGAERLKDILSAREYWLSVGVADGMILAAYLLNYRIDAEKLVLEENDLEDTKFLTPKQLKKKSEFTVTPWKDLKKQKDGIVIGAEKKTNKETEIVMTEQLHALIVGTTGSGKTTSFVDQNIAVLSHCNTKPSLIISDPKKELYAKHAKSLEAQGYRISVLDLREPYAAVKWNPMHVLVRRIRLAKDLEYNLKFKDGKYYGAGEVFVSFDAARTRMQELKDEIYENAQDLVYTLCPIINKDQPTWEECARNLILGLILALCEDCLKGKIEEKQLLLFNVYHNITKYCSEDTTVLKKYLLEGRDEFSKVRGLVNAVLVTSDRTLTSYISSVLEYMQQLSDDGIMSLMSENELDISDLDERPNAVFVIVPDERVTRHRFVTLFITQTYKELVEKANLNFRRGKTESVILKRNVYYVLDEWGNLPRIDNMDGMITVSRSRGIRFLLVLQSFSQIASKYGHEISDTIKSNCNVKLFVGSDDAETRKEFSELCGQKKIKNLSVSTHIETSASGNIGAGNRPLITPSMLERLNGEGKGDAIVSVRGYEPIWTKFTPSYKLKGLYFEAGTAEPEIRAATVFDKDCYVFDLAGDSYNQIREKQLSEIEKQDLEPEKYAQAEKTRLATLDREWYKTKTEIEEKDKELANLLNEADKNVLLSARLEYKAEFLSLILENYAEGKAEEIRKYIRYLTEEALPKLLELQNQAIK